jgi:hypothetical protein
VKVNRLLVREMTLQVVVVLHAILKACNLRVKHVFVRCEEQRVAIVVGVND